MTNRPLIESRAKAFEDLQAETMQSIRNLFVDHGFSELIDVLTDSVYANLLKNVGAASDRKVELDKAYPLTEKAIEITYTSLRLIAFLAEIYQQQTAIELLEKEVNRE